MTKAESGAFGLMIIAALIFVGIAKILNTLGWAIPLIICTGAIVAFLWYKAIQNRKRLEFLRQKYHDEAVVQNIVAHRFWRGQTSEQLVDSLGNPTRIDQNVLKNRERDVWKYYPRGVNRYGLRITLENGIVVGWEQKG